MHSPTPSVKHLLLVGGGHSHLSVLRRLAMRPVPGLTTTLVSRDIVTPYSGSLPGFLAGTYREEDMHIDLRPLAQFAGVRLIQAEVSSIDLNARRLELGSRPPLDFDLLSLNIGSRPNAQLIPGAREHAIGIKPIDQFIHRWQEIRAAAKSALTADDGQYHLVIVGGGPASVEFALAAQARSNQDLGRSPDQPAAMTITLVCGAPSLLAGHNDKTRAFALGELRRRGIDVLLDHKVESFAANQVICAGGTRLNADAMVYATGASLPDWAAKLGLAISEDGFIEVRNTLQSTSHDFVFAAGDMATVRGELRPKSGVYAVRQGKILAHNLVAWARNQRLKHYHPQRKALALMSLSNGSALASRGRLFYQGQLAWRLKHRIDSSFIRKFSELPEMKPDFELASGLVDEQTEKRLRKHALRCAGCGAKVASQTLHSVLSELPATRTAAGQADDAALIDLDEQRVLVQSVDFLKAFVNDPWLFARIATNHSLSDIHAMGLTAGSTQALVGLPPAAPELGKAQLTELMQGCSEMLAAEQCELVGGHSAEADSLQFGLCVNAIAPRQAILHKTGLTTGDCLVLTKPLGTGTLLAADMRYRARHQWMQSAFTSMLQSNRDAGAIAVRHQASACTDITGFGLAGHLLEMLAPGVEVEIDPDAVPVLAGALDCLRADITSSLHHDNSTASASVDFGTLSLSDPRVQLLFDPQTAGGLLFGIPADNAEQCINDLKAAGYEHAVAIGRVLSTGQDQARIQLAVGRRAPAGV